MDIAKMTASDFLSKWVETFNADKSKLIELYAPNASLHGTSSAELYIGRDRIRTYFHGTATVSISHLHCSDVAANVALLVGHCVFCSVLDDVRVETPARFTFLMEKRREDGWVILHHHSSANPK
ncbi:hypothetical protein NCHU2750_42660 (plasmid) [Neorhizobium sp. NCHU2750]|nr:hypothetical protein NCHU2750_42660 [Neorhizobium sp. NCHU2750]